MSALRCLSIQTDTDATTILRPSPCVAIMIVNSRGKLETTNRDVCLDGKL